MVRTDKLLRELPAMQIVPNFRVRTIPVLGTMPSIFGLAAASYILCQLAQAPFHPEPIFKLVEGQYQTQLQRLTEREELIYGNSEGPAVDLDDVSLCRLSSVCHLEGLCSREPHLVSRAGCQRQNNVNLFRQSQSPQQSHVHQQCVRSSVD